MTLSPENARMPSTSLNQGFTTLAHWGLILVEGPDATTLLQSQLSNSVVSLKRTLPGEIAQGPGAVRLVGYCNPKGRLLASAWLGLFPQSADADDRFALFVSKDIAAYLPKMKKGGCLAGHDWSDDGVKQAVTEAFNAKWPMNFTIDLKQDLWRVDVL